MGKKKMNFGGDNNNRSGFMQAVNSASLDYFRPFIKQEVNQAANEVFGRTLNHQAYVTGRVEGLIRAVVSGQPVTMDSIQEGTWDYQDEALGIRKSPNPVEDGDHVRVKLAMKIGDEFKDAGRSVINKVGESKDFPPELQSKLLGMNVGEEKEVTETSSTEPKISYTAKIKVERVCKHPALKLVPDEKATLDESKKQEEPETNENAGQ